MRKILSLFVAFVLGATLVSAKTIYCKMEQGWWKADGAAVGCHSWGTGEGTNWPGVRMTPVEGETDLWFIELDTDKVQNVIFTRVNASGEIADWGAKTKDLTIPVDDKDLFTITSTEAVWGDPGCEGEWSKYEAPVVKPAVTEIEIEGDMSVAGSELTFWVTVSGFDSEPIVTFAVKAGEGEYEQLQRNKFTPTATGNYTVKATAINQDDKKGIYEEAYKEVDFTIGTPAAGITVNVTVPAGTPACYFYGEMSGNTFVEMDKVDDTHYTTEFPDATTIGWGYLFAWEADNWNTKNAEGDFKVEPVNGVIDVEVKAWVTNPGTEYKYTTYTEWQLKYGPAWDWVNTTKQEDGTFTVEAVWGNTGINIASGENPIKQDWYPLGDEALTVAEDVVEGDNVVISLTVVDDETVALEVAKAAAPAEVLPQITEAPKSWAGEYVITAMKDENTALVWTGIDAGQCRVEASVVDKKLTNNDFVKVIVEALQEGGYSIKVKGGTNDGKYITQGATPAYKNALAFVNNPVRVDIAMNDKGLVDIYQVISETENMYLLYNAQAGANNERFRFYKGSNYGQSNYYSLTLFGTPAPQPVGTFDLTIVQDTVWSKDNAKVAAWIWGEELAGQWTSWATNTNDTLTLKVDERADSIIFVRNSPEATEPTWDAWNRIDAGEIDDCHLFIITNWNEGVWCERPVVETKYYAKNNWNGAEDWSWLEMSATDQENIYMLDSVVFGGTGVNINDKEDDTDALYFAVDKIVVLDGLDGFPGPIPPDPRKRDTLIWAPARTSGILEAPTLLAGDTIKLFFNTADNTLKAFIIGRPEQPQPVGTFDLTIVQDTVWSKDNAKVAAWIWGEELAGQWTSWATNTNDTLTLKVDERADSIIFVRNSPEASEPTWEAWNRIDAGEIDDCHLFIITNWNEGVWCERPQPVGEKYYITGNAALVGEEKAWQPDAIEMVDYTHTFPMLAAGEYQLKVTDGTWEHAWGYDNLSPTVAVEGLYTDMDGNICFTVYTPNDVTVTFAQGYVVVTGDFTNPQPAEVKYYITGNAALVGEAKAWDVKAIEMNDSTYTFTALAAGEYEMKITNGAWEPEGQSWGSAALSEDCSAGVDDKGGNIHFIVETANDVTVSIANGSVTVTGIFKESPTPVAGITVNVTVPAGTPACFFYGEMSGNLFVEMDKVDDTHYTTSFPKATTIGWGYKFCWENGNWATCNADPEGDIKVEPVEGVINVEIKAWVTAPQPADEDYGLMINGTTYLPGTPEDKGDLVEYVVSTTLAIGDFVQLYDNVTKAAWTVNPDGQGFTNFDIHDNAYYIKQTGSYQFYIKIPKEGMESALYVGFQGGGTNINSLKALDGKRYNIIGQPVNETYRGIVIMNGQTYLQ